MLCSQLTGWMVFSREHQNQQIHCPFHRSEQVWMVASSNMWLLMHVTLVVPQTERRSIRTPFIHHLIGSMPLFQRCLWSHGGIHTTEHHYKTKFNPCMISIFSFALWFSALKVLDNFVFTDCCYSFFFLDKSHSISVKISICNNWLIKIRCMIAVFF